MEACLPAPDDAWDQLLLDGLPNVGLLDELQLDCDLNGPDLDVLDCLGLYLPGDSAGLGGSGDEHPASSDLLESLQLDATAFYNPASSSGARHSPSGSGSESPGILPMVTTMGGGGGSAATLAPGAHGLPQQPRSSCDRNGDSPATSESENYGLGRGGSPAATGSQQAQAGGSPGQPLRHMSEDEKRLARMQRNRENAQLSRQRKKQQMSELEKRCCVLQQHNQQLTGVVQRLTTENATLRQQLVMVCQQAGRTTVPGAAGTAAVRPVGAAAAQPGTPGLAAVAGVAARPAVPVPAAATTAAAARGLLPQWPLLPFGLLPKVTISLQPQPQQSLPQPQRPALHQAASARPAQPAAAAAAAPAAAAQAAAAAAGRAPKRARTTAAGASTAFLALFTLFMFAGPYTPAPSSMTGSNYSASMAVAGGAGQPVLRALPEAAASGDFLGTGGALRHGGRSLQALPAASSDPGGGGGGGSNHRLLQQQQPRLFTPSDITHAQLDAGGGRLQQLLNSTLQALLLEPGNAQLEAAALQRLKELGPVALLLDADEPGGGGSNPLAASHAFPHLAGQLFGGAGLAVPQMCRKVLEFDAASVPHATRSRRSLERYLLGATGFRGRSLNLAAIGGSDVEAAAAAAEEHLLQAGEARQPLRIDQPRASGAIDADEDDDLQQQELRAASQQHVAGNKQVLLTDGGAGTAGTDPVLVSILLPANASGVNGNGSKLAAVDKVFVVLLHPQDKYVTYSCALPRPVVL